MSVGPKFRSTTIALEKNVVKTVATRETGHRYRLIGVSLIVVGAVWLATSHAQDRRERPRPDAPQPEPLRERDMDRDEPRFRDLQVPRGRDDRNEREGTPEGMPQTRIAPPDDGFRPHLVPDRWILGVHAYNTPEGVIITQVAPRSPAAMIGLEPNDRIVTVEGFQVGYVGRQLYSLGDELQQRADPRGRVRLLVQNWRNNQLVNLDARLQRQFAGFPRPRER